MWLVGLIRILFVILDSYMIVHCYFTTQVHPEPSLTISLNHSPEAIIPVFCLLFLAFKIISLFYHSVLLTGVTHFSLVVSKIQVNIQKRYFFVYLLAVIAFSVKSFVLDANHIVFESEGEYAVEERHRESIVLGLLFNAMTEFDLVHNYFCK